MNIFVFFFILTFSLTSYAEVKVTFNTPESIRGKKKESQCQSKIMKLMKKTNKKGKKEGCSIKMAVYAFDDQEIIKELKEMPNGSVEILVDQSNKGNEKLQKDLGKKGKMIVVGKPKQEKLHEKFAIFDCKEGGDDFPVVFSGSYNWTESAAKINYDNCLIVTGNNKDDRKIIDQFQDRFKELKKEYN